MPTVSPDSVAQDQIKAFFQRWERLEEEKAAISDDLKELFAEAKGNGFDTKVLRKLFRDQKADASERQEFDALYDLYAAALNGSPARDARDAREDEPDHDPETGEITGSDAGTAEAGEATSSVSAETIYEPHVREAATQTVPAPSLPVASSAVEPEAVESSTGGVGGSNAPRINSEPAAVALGAAEPGDRSAVIPAAAPVAATYAAPGIVEMERCQPEGVVAHPFAACWPVNLIDVSKGVREPIVKIGKQILDGRGRYYAAREAGIEYPVVQYDGSDPLLDCIRWNLASRKTTEQQRRLIAGKLAKIEPARADDIMLAFDRHLEAAE